MDLTLIVLAAGLSTRYGGLKQLEVVGPDGETILDYGIYDAFRAGFARVVLVIRRELEEPFAERMARMYGDALEVAFAYQELEPLPTGFSVPAGRRKPWGTGHAVLAARARVTGPFVAMNADDFYGAAAFARLAEHLRHSAAGDFAAAGYNLRDTLSPHGGVSRAVCELDSAGYLMRVSEVKEIEERGGRLAGVTAAGATRALTGDEIVSMNLWAATPLAFDLLEDRFVRFLEKEGASADSEFLLSEAVNELIAGGAVRVKVIPTPGPWLGMTYEADRPEVIERIGQLVASGEYPRSIGEWFHSQP